jgi:hypothetical protein
MPIAAAIAPVVLGGIQAISGAQKAREAQAKLETLPTPGANQSILDYYQNALQRYNASPYQSAMYKAAQDQIQRHMAFVIANNQNAGLHGGIVPNVLQASNDASQRAGNQAILQNRQDFATLGKATGMKAQTEQQAANAAFQKQYGLLGLKASGGNKEESAGINNIWGGITSGLQTGAFGNIFGNKTGGNTPIFNYGNNSRSYSLDPSTNQNQFGNNG